MIIRELVVQRSIDVNQLNSVCDIVSLLQEVGLMTIVEDISPYSKLLVSEFYYNMIDAISDPSTKKLYKIFIRGKWYNFSPEAINNYYG